MDEVQESAHKKVDGGKDRNCPEAAQIGVCEESADEGSDVAGAAPVGDIVRCCGRVLVQNITQVHHHVGCNSIICKALATFLR